MSEKPLKVQFLFLSTPHQHLIFSLKSDCNFNLCDALEEKKNKFSLYLIATTTTTTLMKVKKRVCGEEKKQMLIKSITENC
jgi:hypothetical protein